MNEFSQHTSVHLQERLQDIQLGHSRHIIYIYPKYTQDGFSETCVKSCKAFENQNQNGGYIIYTVSGETCIGYQLTSLLKVTALAAFQSQWKV